MCHLSLALWLRAGLPNFFDASRMRFIAFDAITAKHIRKAVSGFDGIVDATQRLAANRANSRGCFESGMSPCHEYYYIEK
jgi:hypothetical protein